MHIGSMRDSSKMYGFTMNLKVGQTNAKKAQAAGEEEKPGKKAGSFKAAELKKKEEFSMAEMLKSQKDSLQKRLAGYNKQLESIASQREALHYDTMEVEENGEIKEIKIYTEEKNYSDEKKETLSGLIGQEESTLADIDTTNEEMLALDEQIRAALIEQEKQKLERINREKEKERKENIEKKDEHLTEEEKKEKAEKAQSEFFAQSDSVKKYINDSKITQAKMQAEKTLKETWMAKDAYRQEETAVRANYAANQTRIEALEDDIEEKTGVRPEIINMAQKTPDSTVSEHVSRVRAGELSPDEGKSVDAKEIDKLQEGIDGLENSINENIGKINEKARELEKEKEEDRVSKDKKDEEEAEENKSDTLKNHKEE